MTSYRSYSDTGTYKGRSSNGLGGSFARSSTGTTTLPNYRSTYTGASSSRMPAKDRTTSGYSSLDKSRDRDKSDDKPAYKYSAGGKDVEKSRLNCGRTSAEDLSSKSSLSDSRSSVLDRYSYSSNRANSERPSSVLEKYSNRTVSREKPRESDVSSRYVTSTYPGSGLRGNYGNDPGRIEKKERIDHPPISYRGIRSNSGRSSREPSPEVSNGKAQFRMYSKTPTYGRSSNVSGSSDTSAVSSITSRLMNQSSRISSPRSPSLTSTANSERLRTPVNKSTGSIIPKNVEKLTKSSESKTDPVSEGSQKDSKVATKTVEPTESATSQTKELREERNEEEEEEEEKEEKDEEESMEKKTELGTNATITLTMISRCTSPTPPSASSFVSRRRADVARLFQREITRSVKRPEMRDSEMQSDRMDDTARYSRFGSSTSRVVSSPWSSYLDKLSSAGTSTRSYGNFSNSSTSGRINSSFGYTRQNENPATGRVEITRERPSPSPPRISQNNRELRSSLTPEVQTISHANIHKSGSRNTVEKETSQDDSSSSFHTVSRGESSPVFPRQSSSDIETHSSSKCPKNPVKNEDNNQKRTSSISKLARASSKSDGKTSQSSSKSEMSGSAENSLTTVSTSISTTSSSPAKLDDHHRNVEAQSENYTEINTRDVSRRRRENSQSSTNSSISSKREGANRSESLSPSASKSISRLSSSKSVSRKMTRTEASSPSSPAHTSDGVNSVSVPTGRTKSSSSLTSQPIKIKTASSSSLGGGSQNSCKNASSSSSSSLLGNASSSQLNKSNSSETRGKPPVPKTDTSGIMKIPNASGKYVNKDFRKSALNMENGDGSRSSKHPDRKRGLNRDKCRRSVSASSQDSEINSESNPVLVSPGSSSASSKSSRSPGKLRINESRSDISKKSASETKSVSPSVSRLAMCRNSKSRSGSPVRRKQQVLSSGTSSSSDSSSESSCSSCSSSENDEPREQSSKERSIGGSSNGSKRRRKRTMSSPRMERKMSVGSSRTSVLLSSADESSLAMDKPPRPPSSPRSRSDRSSKAEDAKSFLMRALAPVASIFRGKQPDSGSEDWPENTDNCNDQPSDSCKRPPTISKSISPSLSKSLSFTNPSPQDRSTSGERLRNSTIKRESSGERPWWMDPNSDNVPDGVERVGACQDEISQETTISTVLPDDGKFRTKLWKQDSGERAWWLDANDNIPQDTVKNEYATSSPISRKSTSRCSTKSSELRSRIKHQQSGERAWWLSEDPSDVPEGVEIFPVEQTSNSTSNDNSGSLAPSETLSRTLNGIRHIESGERAWWMDSNSNIPEGIVKITPDIDSNSNSDSSESFEKHEILSNDRISSYQRKSEISSSLSRFPLEFNASTNSNPDRTINSEEPLGERASPEGVENPPDPPESHYETGRKSPYDNVPRKESRRSSFRKRPTTLPLFIGNHKNIDDVLGEISSPRHSPVLSRIRSHRPMEDYSEDSSECEEIDAAQVIIHDSTPKTPIIQRRSRDTERPQPDGYIPLDDTALQLYKDGDYGAYLDLEASINEQQEEFEGFQTNRKNSIVLRTQLSVRVHTIIEKLLNSEGRELRRALFSLKQTFQEDKDLVHEFVQNDGLACLIRVGNDADQNYQNYILRALGQVMLYVDGMNGVMEHGQTVQWLYTLIASRFRLVVKTALKLLLVFVEYIETNSLLLVRAVRSVDTSRGMIPWTNVMRLFKDYDAADTELLIYATTLVNKCLNGIPDQDTYYDQVDCLEDQGIEAIIQRYMSKQGTDLDLLRQFQIYEAVLHHEDGNDRGSPIKQLDDNIRKTLRNRKSLVDSHGRRKSRRHSTGTSPLSMSLSARLSPGLNHSHGLNSLNGTLNSSLPDDDDESSSSQSSQGLGEVQLNGSYKENKPGFPVDVGVTPALRRRRERAERQRSFIREQQEATANMRASIVNPDDQEAPFATNGMRFSNGSPYDRNTDSPCNKLSRANSRKDLTPIMNAANKLDSEEKKPWYGKSPDEGVECDEGNHTDEDEDRRVVIPIKREGTVKDLTQKLTAQNLIPSSPVEDKVSRIGDMSGLISKAKEGLAKSKSKADVLKSPTGDNLPKLTEVKKSENELHWEELVNKLNRPLALCDLDFTDLTSDDEIDVLGPVNVTNGVPPPPPPMVSTPVSGFSRAPPPPPPGGRFPPPFPNGVPPLFGVNLKSTRTGNSPENSSTIPKNSITSTSTNQTNGPAGITKKSKKTVKLFWKEVRDDPIILTRLDKNKMIWDELLPVPVDTQKLEHLFESRAKDLITKEKQQEMNKNKEIIVLDHKRSNAINIGMTKLPPPRSIKTAILKMDATIMNREGIEKLLTMLPTEEERSRIQEAQAANPDLPLGSAEQFLLTLASISELPARLKLWAFKLDFENSEKEIADPLMDLKQGMETLRVNKTFRGILSTLLSIGIFLNGNEVKGFQLEYLAKVPEVKDTVHKHSLLHHLCHMVMEKFPDSTDLYSEIGAVTRASKIDFDELASNIGKLESECKASWDHLKLITKHDGSTMMKVKMSDFLSDCAERIIVLEIVHRRIINRFHKFILWLGIPLHRVQDTKPNEFSRIVSEFALEYRTTRERVIQQLEKKANHRERNKTRGKMITEVGKFRTKEDRADAELRQLLGSDISDVESLHGTLPWRRQRKDGRTALGPIIRDERSNGNVTDGDDELLESLVKTATKTPATRTTPRERKRTRHADLKRSRTRENNTTPEGYQP